MLEILDRINDFMPLDGWAGVYEFSHVGTSIQETRKKAEEEMEYIVTIPETGWMKGKIYLMHLVWKKRW
jgi:phage-related protein